MEKLQTILEGPVKQLQNQGYIPDHHNGAKKIPKKGQRVDSALPHVN